MSRTRSVHVMVVTLASACADLAFKVEQLDARLDDATAAVGRIEAQHGHGRPHGNEFLGLAQSSLPAPPARDMRPAVLERNASIDKRFAALERTKALSSQVSGGGVLGGGGGSFRHGNAMLYGTGEIATGSGDVSVSGRRLAAHASSISGVESKEAAATAGGKNRHSSTLRADIFTAATPSPPPGPGSRMAMSFSVAPGPAGLPSLPSAVAQVCMAESFTAGMQVTVPAAARKARPETLLRAQQTSSLAPATAPAISAPASAAPGVIHPEVIQQPVAVKSSEIEEQ
ncbi:hypothetical protein Vretimale_1277 [Volvox reticuliferus]|uniref:Uncharacterized protein n=2 Tax=Volvox reticuliferus TaxID=1737510 RepID=A0A8J4D448_9CHLO|nr:hypothetical protein Vretimale_1277 [Volvox reticuliferus]